MTRILSCLSRPPPVPPSSPPSLPSPCLSTSSSSSLPSRSPPPSVVRAPRPLRRSPHSRRARVGHASASIETLCARVVCQRCQRAATWALTWGTRVTVGRPPARSGGEGDGARSARRLALRAPRPLPSRRLRAYRAPARSHAKRSPATDLPLRLFLDADAQRLHP